MSKEKLTIKDLASSLKRMKNYFNDKLENAKPLQVSERAIKAYVAAKNSETFDKDGLTTLLVVNEANKHYTPNVNVPNVLDEHIKITESLLVQHGEEHSIDIPEAIESYKALGVTLDESLDIVNSTLKGSPDSIDAVTDAVKQVSEITDDTQKAAESLSESLSTDEVTKAVESLSESTITDETQKESKGDDVDLINELKSESLVEVDEVKQETVKEEEKSSESVDEIVNNGLNEAVTQAEEIADAVNEGSEEKEDEKEKEDESDLSGETLSERLDETDEDEEDENVDGDDVVDIDFSKVTFKKGGKAKVVEILKNNDLEEEIEEIDGNGVISVSKVIADQIQEFIK